ncbi:hypothetical protein V2J94_03975 [Streptomyces sp. DSM 41524]|uniref:Uncharacterized protein n=1 Tax=Streptomyces asiaticus subsp. ignotus TaxID=3098222 RepID=A0ABU7PRF8_9ACTN|nr:hypothetical protein [Streptomyces sp. DSM 41524]
MEVVFVAEALDGVEDSTAVQAATRGPAARLMRICSDVTAEGTI